MPKKRFRICEKLQIRCRDDRYGRKDPTSKFRKLAMSVTNREPCHFLFIPSVLGVAASRRYGQFNARLTFCPPLLSASFFHTFGTGSGRFAKVWLSHCDTTGKRGREEEAGKGGREGQRRMWIISATPISVQTRACILGCFRYVMSLPRK